MDRESEETVRALVEELETLAGALDKTLKELTVVASILASGFKSLADLAGRLSRNVNDPPPARHTLEIDGAGHGQAAEILDPDPS